MTGKVLVTGGAGFIGSHVADAFLAGGYEVTILDNLSSGRQENVPRGTKLVRADIALKGSGGIMSKSDQQVSVPWEQLSVKRQGGNFVLVLNQEAMQKIQTIEKQDNSNKQNQQQKK